MNFKAELSERTDYANEVLDRCLPDSKKAGFPKLLAESMNYSVRAGGKRVRPILLLESHRLIAGEDDPALVEPFMAAIEMIHTHSLVHDDLPAIDNDDERRGMAATHKVYGEAMAVLAGDGLLNYAYETVLRAAAGSGDNGRILHALRVLSEKAGIGGMLGGQSVDVENDKRTHVVITRDRLDYIYEKKTSALIEAPLMIGAILAGADDETVDKLEEIGRKTGLAFQVRDDVLDQTGAPEKIGKTVGSDRKNGKKTAVSFLGLEGAGHLAEQLTGEAVALLEALPYENPFLAEFLKRMANRTH